MGYKETTKSLKAVLQSFSKDNSETLELDFKTNLPSINVSKFELGLSSNSTSFNSSTNKPVNLDILKKKNSILLEELSSSLVSSDSEDSEELSLNLRSNN